MKSFWQETLEKQGAYTPEQRQEAHEAGFVPSQYDRYFKEQSNPTASPATPPQHTSSLAPEAWDEKPEVHGEPAPTTTAAPPASGGWDNAISAETPSVVQGQPPRAQPVATRPWDELQSSLNYRQGGYAQNPDFNQSTSDQWVNNARTNFNTAQQERHTWANNNRSMKIHNPAEYKRQLNQFSVTPADSRARQDSLYGGTRPPAGAAAPSQTSTGPRTSGFRPPRGSRRRF